jgi:Kef-type K+ transport system membrane component KefB
MKNLILIFVFFAVFAVIKLLPVNLEVHEVATLLVGVVLLTSYLISDLVKKVSLPKLTGYMIIGSILGPSGVEFLTQEIMDNLQFLENLALSFIALTAGGELKFFNLKRYGKPVTLILFSQIIIIFVGMFLVFFFLGTNLVFFAHLPIPIIMVLAILFAGTALSTSPATTIGIITELSARGNVTNIILIITVLKAIFLILIFPIVIALAELTFIDNASLNISFILNVTLKLLGSVLIGILSGILIIWYVKNIKVEISIFLLAVALAITEVSSVMGLQILLTSMVAGIVVQNFSRQGNSLIKGVEIFSLPIYVIFFCFAGAKLHFEEINKALFLTLALVIARFVLNFLGNYVGALIAKESKIVRNVSWLGYIGQAGIALGLGMIIEPTLPREIAGFFLTLIISTVVINELAGPILLKYVFIKAGEAEVKD